MKRQSYKWFLCRTLSVILLLSHTSFAVAGEDDKLLATELKVGTKLILKKDLTLNKCGASDLFVNLGTGDCDSNNDNLIIGGRKCVIRPFGGANAAENLYEKGSSIEVTSVTSDADAHLTVRYKRGQQLGYFTCSRLVIDPRDTPISMASFRYNIREYFEVYDPTPMRKILTGLLPKVSDLQEKHGQTIDTGRTEVHKPVATPGQ